MPRVVTPKRNAEAILYEPRVKRRVAVQPLRPDRGKRLAPSFPLELARNRGTKIDGKEMLDVHEILQLMPVEMMLLYHKVVPVR